METLASNSQQQQQRKKKPQRKSQPLPLEQEVVPVELQKAEEEMGPAAALVGQMIKTRGQIEEEERMAQREAFVQQRKEEKQREAERYSQYFRWGMFGTLIGSVAFLGYWFKFKNTQDVEPVAAFVGLAGSAAK